MKKLSIIIAMLLVVALAVPTFANPFTDVPANHWAYEAVNKLVAAGIISGYPDGTYKGQNNLTRYEIAVVVSRALDNIAAEREALAKGLTTEQAQDVTAIVKALMEQNLSTGSVDIELPESLTDEQADEVANLIEALTFEFKAELKVLGAKIDAVDARVEALENPVVSFSGEYAVDLNHTYWEGTVYRDVDYFEDDGTGTGVPVWDDDPYVYTDPWDHDTDEIYFNEDNGFSQTLDLTTSIVKDGLSADITFDITESDHDELDIDSASLVLENDDVAVTYNSETLYSFTDYYYSEDAEEEINGVNVNLKNYGVNTYFGNQDVVVVEDAVPAADKFTDEDLTEPLLEDLELPFYIYGAEKDFNVGGMDLTAKLSGRLAQDEEVEDFGFNIFDLNAATDLSGLEVDSNLAFIIPEAELEDADMPRLLRLNASNDLDIGSVDFNLRNANEEFVNSTYSLGTYADSAAFDVDHDDYSRFTTAVIPGNAFDVTVKPNIIEGLDASVLFANYSVDVEADNNIISVDDVFYKDEKGTKIALNGEMAVLMDGLTVNGKYETETVEIADENKENTMGFGAEYALADEKGTASFNYENVDPVEEAEGEVESTMTMEAEYNVSDYISGNFTYETIGNYKFVEDDKVKEMILGADVTDYPVFGDITASAGFSRDAVSEKYDETATELSLGLGYNNLSYDFTNTKVEGDDLGYNYDWPGVYTTHKIGYVYPIVEGTDLTVDYQVFDLDSDDEALQKDYKVKKATAGVSIAF